MEPEQDLDLLDLEDTAAVDTLPEATPFSSPRPKRPWLLMGLGVAIIVLATWIIIARVGGDSGTSVNIDLDAPVETVDDATAEMPDLKVPPKSDDVAVKPEVKPVPAPVVEKPQPAPVETKPVETNGTPVRVVADRKEVTFNPDKATVEKPAAKPAAKKTVSKPVATATSGNIYVQFGSYSTRALAQSAEQKIRKAHPGLFADKQFVILAAQVKGQTTYRLRIAFQNANAANGFCRNAKSDGLDCYVTK